MRGGVLVIGLLLVPVAAGAQPQVNVGVRLGAEQHGGMGELGDWQAAERAQVEESGLSVAVTDDFPPYAGVGVTLGVQLASVEWGMAAGVSSTGGRLAYSDYSGTLTIDRTVRRRALGAYVNARVADVGPARVLVGLEGRVSWTSITYDRLAEVGSDVVDSISAKMRAAPLSVEPSISLETAVSGPLLASLRVGWEVSQSQEVEPHGELPAAAAGPIGTVGWSGMRAGVGLTMRFGR